MNTSSKSAGNLPVWLKALLPQSGVVDPKLPPWGIGKCQPSCRFLAADTTHLQIGHFSAEHVLSG